MTTHSKYFFAATLVLTCAANSAHAEPKPAQESNSKRPSLYRALLKPVDIFAMPAEATNRITMPQFYERLVGSNLQIRQYQFDLEAARDAYRIVFKDLRPKFTLSSSVGKSLSYTNSVLSEGQTSDIGLGMVGNTDWGISYGANFPKLSVTKAEADGVSAPQSNSLIGDAQVSFSLLRNSAFFVGGFKTKRARYAYDSAKQGYRSQVINLLYENEKLFYDVFTAQAQVAIDEYTLKTIEALLEESKELYRQGEIAHFEVVQVELQLENSRSALLASQNTFQLALEQLREALNAEEIVYPDAKEVMAIPPQPTLEFESIYKTATENRADFIKAKWDLDQSTLSVREARSETWPSLNLVANHSRSRADEKLGTTLQQPLALGDPKTSVSLVLTYELSNYAAENAYKNSLTAKLKQQISFDTAQNQLRKEVSSTITSVRNTYKRYESVLKAKTLAIEKLQAEFDRYRLGESSIKNVIDFQKEVNAQEKSDLEGRIAVLQGLANLRKVQGLPPEKADANLVE